MMISSTTLSKRIEELSTVLVHLQKKMADEFIQNKNIFEHSQRISLNKWEDDIYVLYQVDNDSVCLYYKQRKVLSLYTKTKTLSSTTLDMRALQTVRFRKKILDKEYISDFVAMHSGTNKGFTLYNELTSHNDDTILIEPDIPEIHDDTEDWFSTYLLYGEKDTHRYAMQLCTTLTDAHWVIGELFFSTEFDEALLASTEALNSTDFSNKNHIPIPSMNNIMQIIKELMAQK